MKTKRLFLQLQFCLLLSVCTLMPDLKSFLGSFMGIPSVDIPVLLGQLIGIAGATYALYALYQAKKLPTVFLSVTGSGLFLAALTLIPNLPIWIEYIALIVLAAALWMAKKNIGIEWNKANSQGVYMILLAILLQIYNSIESNTTTDILALTGLIVYLIGLSKLKENLDDNGTKAASRLKIAVILGIAAVVLDWIPLIGGIIANILLIIAFILEFTGFTLLKQSASLGTEGQQGAVYLRNSMIILLAGTIIDLFPLTGTVVALISLIAIWFVFKGWNNILTDFENQSTEQSQI